MDVRYVVVKILRYRARLVFGRYQYGESRDARGQIVLVLYLGSLGIESALLMYTSF